MISVLIGQAFLAVNRRAFSDHPFMEAVKVLFLAEISIEIVAIIIILIGYLKWMFRFSPFN